MNNKESNNLRIKTPIKVKYNINTSSYKELICEICDMVLEKNECKKRELEDLKLVIDKIFYFLQEKVNEKDYLKEEFFKELIKMYAKIIERLRM